MKYNSGGCATVVYYALVRRTELKLVKNAKVIRNKECIPQHKLLVAVRNIQTLSKKPCFIAAKRKLWKFRESEVQPENQNFIEEHYADATISCVKDAWNNLKNCLLSGVDKVCGKKG